MEYSTVSTVTAISLTLLFTHASYSGTEAMMPGILDQSIEQSYTGHVFQPQRGEAGTLGGTDADYYEEEPPLLEGKTSSIIRISLKPV